MAYGQEDQLLFTAPILLFGAAPIVKYSIVPYPNGSRSSHAKAIISFGSNGLGIKSPEQHPLPEPPLKVINPFEEM